VVRPNPDPWNWGWEESGISTISEPLSNSSNNNNNNPCSDPAWGWSTDSTTTYQEDNISSITTGHSARHHGQKGTTAASDATFSAGPNATVMTPSTAAVIAESFSSVSGDQTALFHSSASQLHEGNKRPFTLNFVKNDTISHPVTNSVSQYATISTASLFNQDTCSHGSDGAKSDFEQGFVNNVKISQETYRAGASEDEIENAHVVTQELKNIENVKQDIFQSSVDCVRRGEEFTNVPIGTKSERDAKEESDSAANDVPELSRESSSREQDISKRSCSTGNDGLSSQWSTESLPSSEELSQTVEGVEMVSSHSSQPQSSLATDTLQVNKQSYENSSCDSNNDHQNSTHVERAEEPQCLNDVSNNTSVDESRYLCHQGYQNYCTDAYALNQATDETATWKQDTGNRAYTQVDTNSNMYGQMSVGSNISALTSSVYVRSDLYTTQPESVMNVALVSTETVKTSSVEVITSAVDNLTVSSNENLRSPDVENKEIVYPEIEENSGITLPSLGPSNPSHLNNVHATPLPAVPGPPPKSIGITQGRNSNPYSLNQKNANKYQASLPSGEGAAGGIDRRNYNIPHIPSIGPTEPVVNVAQYGALPEIMSHTVNNLIQPTYSHKTMETPGSFVNRKKKTTPPPLTAEDAVNLETVPDNKERPDFIDVPQVAPITRLHAAPVGQVNFGVDVMNAVEEVSVMFMHSFMR